MASTKFTPGWAAVKAAAAKCAIAPRARAASRALAAERNSTAHTCHRRLSCRRGLFAPPAPHVLSLQWAVATCRTIAGSLNPMPRTQSSPASSLNIAAAAPPPKRARRVGRQLPLVSKTRSFANEAEQAGQALTVQAQADPSATAASHACHTRLGTPSARDAKPSAASHRVVVVVRFGIFRTNATYSNQRSGCAP